MANAPYMDDQFGTVSFDVVSSTITTSFVNKLLVLGDRIVVEDVIIETDGTGVVGPTLFQIKKSDTTGAAIILSHAVSALGANVTFDLSTATTKNRSVCAPNTYIGVLGTSSVGTGAGVCRVTIKYRKLNQNSIIQVV